MDLQWDIVPLVDLLEIQWRLAVAARWVAWIDTPSSSLAWIGVSLAQRGGAPVLHGTSGYWYGTVELLWEAEKHCIHATISIGLRASVFSLRARPRAKILYAASWRHHLCRLALRQVRAAYQAVLRTLPPPCWSTLVSTSRPVSGVHAAATTTKRIQCEKDVQDVAQLSERLPYAHLRALVPSPRAGLQSLRVETAEMVEDRP